MHFAIGAEKGDLHQPCALPPPLQHAVKLVRQMLNGTEHVLFASDGIGETPLRYSGGQRQPRTDRFILTAERLINAADEILSIAGGERSARAIQHIGNAFQTSLRQRGHGFRIDPQSRERQRRQSFARRGFSHDRCPAIARDRPGAADRVGHRHAGLQTLPGQPLDQITAERRLAAEQMRAAGDVEQDAVRHVETSQRRIAVAPVSDGFEQGRVRLRIGIRRRQRADTSRARRPAPCRQ